MNSDIRLSKRKINYQATIHLPVSKSECNRALILSRVSNGKITVKNISSSKDSQTLFSLLKKIEIEKTTELDCGPAGTTFRFLTALLSAINGEFLLTGSSRMKERPIGELVTALTTIGAQISYTGKPGFPPLRISGQQLTGGTLNMDPSVSSQFVSALMMIAPITENGIRIIFDKEPVSRPYLLMTKKMMEMAQLKLSFEENELIIPSQDFSHTDFYCENDWSAASYFYALVAINKDLKIHLTGLRESSLQGDAVIQNIFEFFGVETEFDETGATIYNNNTVTTDYLEYDFADCPDLAQTIAFTCAALRIDGKLTGLQTLKNKETDRIAALKNELEKCGMRCRITGDSISFSPEKSLPVSITFDTYEDHRMAMAAAMMGLVCEEIKVKDATVVEKSFPEFWQELRKIFSA